MRQHLALTKHNVSSSGVQRNEKSVLDNVEDMDVDSQSDQEGTCEEGTCEESFARISNSSGSNTLIRGKYLRNNKGNKDCTTRGDKVIGLDLMRCIYTAIIVPPIYYSLQKSAAISQKLK